MTTPEVHNGEQDEEIRTFLADLQMRLGRRWGEQAVPPGWTAKCPGCGLPGHPVLAIRFGPGDLVEVLSSLSGEWLVVGVDVGIVPEKWLEPPEPTRTRSKR